MRRNDVVMFHIGRCGSTVLGDLLDQHPDMAWDGELLEVHQMGFKRRILPPKAYVHYRRLRRISKKPGTYGFEIKYLRDLDHVHMDLPELLEWLRERSFSRFLVLHRENYLRRLVSLRIAVQTGQFHRRASDHPVPASKVRVAGPVPFKGETFSLVEYFEMFDAEADRLRLLLGDSACYLGYELHIEKNPMDAYRRASDFLGLSDFEPHVRYVRKTPQRTRELVADYDLVVEQLAGTRWEWMLHDADV